MCTFLCVLHWNTENVFDENTRKRMNELRGELSFSQLLFNVAMQNSVRSVFGKTLKQC